ncbi:MAG TPA: ABC transporter ATP-binding protein [Kiritimatiellia bacterium]|nr:ABC transporter ATP-binding protein [Kiritimatiellia bacterium]
MNVLTVHDLYFHYRHSNPVFQGLSFELKDNERVGLTGSNGSGKSTLFQILMGFRKPDRGTINWYGSEITTESMFAEVRRKVGLLFQQPDDQLFCATVGDEVAFGPFNLGLSRSEVLHIVEETLASLNLQGYADRITYHLSEGEKRLVSLAAVLAMKPDVLLLDEPTNGLDERSKELITQHLAQLPQMMLIASHDQSFLEKLTNRRIDLNHRT